MKTLEGLKRKMVPHSSERDIFLPRIVGLISRVGQRDLNNAQCVAFCVKFLVLLGAVICYRMNCDGLKIVAHLTGDGRARQLPTTFARLQVRLRQATLLILVNSAPAEYIEHLLLHHTNHASQRKKK